MGIADTIPGVSGGTIAFITGIYTRLLKSINGAFAAIPLLLKLKWKQAFQKIDFSFLLPLFIGIGLAIFFLSKTIDSLLTNYPAATFAFFFGLIIASALVLLKQAGAVSAEKAVFAALGFVVAYTLAGLPALQATHTLPVIFLAGAVAIAAMILPGISGAFILLLLGQYQYLIQSLHSYNLAVVGTFLVGALFGLFTFSHLISTLLKNFKAITIAFLIGLMVGSLRVPIIHITEAGGMSFYAFLAGFVGLFIVFFINWGFKEK